jgi:formate-dependent nitrite reductase membrane component NrfD
MSDSTKPKGLLKAPHWGANVAAYLFLGGMMGGLGLLAALARPDVPAQRRLRRATRRATFALAVVNPPLLISHLGRPERFLNMLRILKLRSPMSVGVWSLVAYGNLAALSVLSEAAGDALAPAQGALGAFISGYTGVLLSATAVPVWGAGKRHLPALFVCSGITTACALALLSSAADDDRVAHSLEWLETIAALGELALLHDYRRSAGRYGDPLFTGRCGRLLATSTVGAGLIAPLAMRALATVTPRRLRRPLRTLSSLLTLAGGATLRALVIEAGKRSVEDASAGMVQPT